MSCCEWQCVDCGFVESDNDPESRRCPRCGGSMHCYFDEQYGVLRDYESNYEDEADDD